MTEKLESFRAILEAQTLARMTREYGNSEVNRINSVCRIHDGAKYVRVDVGSSGKYMVVKATGEIFGIKAYGVIHRGHPYGTLDTLDQFDWSGYSAHRIAVAA